MIPAVIATNGLGMPVRPVDKNAPSMVISPNGLGIPVVISDLGIPYIISGLEPAFQSMLSGDTWPDQPQTPPTSLIPEDAGEFNTATGWNTLAGMTIADGVARWDGTSAATSNMLITLTTPAVAGRRYGFLNGVSAFTSGNAVLGLTGPSLNSFGSGSNSVYNRSRQILATGAHPQARIAVAAGSVMDIDYLRLYDIDSLLEKKWRIVFVYSQSNWVGAEEPEAADRYENDTPEARAVVIPSREQTTRGAQLDVDGIGVPMLMCDPVVHMSGNVGGGPAGAFARTFCDGLRDDEVLVYVAAGYSGGGRLTPGDVWYNEGGTTGGIAWENLIKQMDALVDRAPEGSTVAGCLFCQGEADRLVNTGDQHAESIRGDFEFLRERYGNFPIVINEIGYVDTAQPTVAPIIAGQKKLDENSGDPLALPFCRYVERPADSTFLPDDLHYTQVTQRQRGYLAAVALLGINYGEVAPGMFRITAGTASGYTGYSDGSIVGSAGSIEGDFSGFPVVQLYSSTGSDVLVAITGDHTAAMTNSRIVIDGVSLSGGTSTYDAGGDYTYATYPGFSFIDGATYTCELILEE